MPTLMRPSGGTAAVVAAVVADHGQSVVLVRAGSAMGAQSCVLDWYGVSAAETAMVEAASGQAGLPVVKIHGAADADIERGDRFVAGGWQCSVVMVSPSDGYQVVAYAQGQQV